MERDRAKKAEGGGYERGRDLERDEKVLPHKFSFLFPFSFLSLSQFLPFFIGRLYFEMQM